MDIKLPQNLDFKTYIFKSFTFKDLLAIGFFVLVGAILALLPIKYKAFFLGIGLALAFVSLLNVNGRRSYEHLIIAINYLTAPKTLNYKSYCAYMGLKSIENNHFKLLNGNLCFVFFLHCKTSIFYNDVERAELEDDLQTLLNKKVVRLKIVKLSRKYNFEKQAQLELERAKELNQSNLSKKQKTVLLNVVQSRLDVLASLNQSNATKEQLYIIAEVADEQALTGIIKFNPSSFSLEILKEIEFKDFCLSYINFNIEANLSGELDPANIQKSVVMKAAEVDFEDFKISGIFLKKMPVNGNCGYLNLLLHAPATCVEIDITSLDMMEAVKHLDNLALELNSRQTQRKSGLIEEELQMQSLSEHIYKVSQENLAFFKFGVSFFSKGEKESALVKQYLRQKNFTFDTAKYRQDEVFSRLVEKRSKSNTNFLATSEQLAQGLLMQEGEIVDENGFLIGQNSTPVFLDFGKKTLEHLNSNCIVIGNSGAGKSYFAKSLILHLSTQLTRTYILDPEGEYDILVENLDSKVIEVAASEGCKINPFHVDAESDFSNHLHFLDEFFKATLCLTPIAQELLNFYILEIYNEKNKKKPSFEALYELIKKAKTSSANSNESYLDELLVNLQKFIKDGRDAYLYKDEVQYDEGLITSFNFSKLFQTKNKVLINSQLLLMLKHVETRVLENYKKGLKSAIFVDEAHLFFSADNTAALDFLYQIAKRIRKYNGMIVVITQNLKDFTAERELEKKTQAIVSACQYSFIFPLHPGEVNLLQKVYSSGVRLGDLECDTIAKNKRGTAFFISLGFLKENISIYAPDYMKNLFEEKKEL